MTDRNLPSTTPAVSIDRFGDLDVLHLADCPIPQAVDDEVLVRVRAASINPVDWKIAAGAFAPIGEDRLPLILGRDLAGTIEAVGTRAHYMLSQGDRVMAFIGQDRGAQSGLVVVKAVELVAMPEGIGFDAAAAIGLVSMTAWQALFDHGGLKAGQRVLIHGGAGGVGHVAVQLARWAGAEVWATASADDQDFVRTLGATPIDYRAQRFEDVVGDLDLVLDTQGDEVQQRSFAVLRRGGTMVSTLDPDLDRAAAEGIAMPPRWHAEPNAEQLGKVAELMASGDLVVEIARTFPFDRFRDGYALARDGHLRGKVVLTID